MSTAPLPSLSYGNQPRRNWTWLVLKIAIAIGAFVAILAAMLLLLLWYIIGEKRFNTSSQGAIISQVMNGTLVPNAAGVVRLPASLASTTIDGNVYVTVDASGTTWILFPTWSGKGANTFGYAYHNTPATGGADADLAEWTGRFERRHKLIKRLSGRPND